MSTVITAKRFGLIAAALAILTTVLVSMVAFFTARANETVSFTVSHFAKDGYALERTAPNDYFLAGESVTAKIKESNTEDSDIRATLTMSAVWNSPDPNSKLWSSDSSEANAALTLDGDPISYAVQADGSITFDLPAVSLSASQSIERDLVLKIPDSLKGTGTVTFSFDKAIVKGTNASWSNTYSREDLNGQEDLSYAIPVAWNISKNQSTKDLIAYLTDSEGQYGLEIIKNGKSINTNNSEMMDFSIDKSKAAHDITQWSSGAPWYSYRSDLISVSMPDELTTIGDGAFLNLSAWTIQQLTVGEHVASVGEAAFGNVNAITSVTIPKSVMSIESQAFGSLPNTDTFTFAHGTGDILSLPDNTDGNGAFHVGDPYSQNNPRETRVIYKIEAVREYNWGADNRGHLISIEERPGGTMTADRTVAIEGQEITLTTTPEDKYKYKGATYAYTDENGNEQTVDLAPEVLSFTMPDSAVTVSPKWLAPPVLAAQDTWFTQGGTTIAKGSISSINLVDEVDSATKNAAGDNYWDASDGQKGTVHAYAVPNGDGTYALTIAGNGYGKIFANADSTSAFTKFTAATAITGFNNGTFYFDTSNVAKMGLMFSNCENLTSLDVSRFDTSNVTQLQSMFANCYKIPSLDVGHFNTSNATYMNQMFQACRKLTALDVGTETVTANGKTYTAWDTSSVKNMSNMFYQCSSMTSLNVGNWDTSSATNMRALFGGCLKLTELDVSQKTVTIGEDTYITWNTGNVTNMQSMFSDCHNVASLDVSKFDTSKVTTIHQMFYSCSSLLSLDVSNWDVRNVTDMGGTFTTCYKLEVLDVSDWKTQSLEKVNFSLANTSDTGKVYHEEGIFMNCEALEVIDISGWDMSNVTNTARMFDNCVSLKSLTIPASASVISPEFAYSCTSLTEITFKHSSTDPLEMPIAGKSSVEHTAENPNIPGVYADGGAFYVPSYLETTINATNDVAKNYDWVTDHRAEALPVLAAKRTWYTQGGTSIEKSSITSINLVDEIDSATKSAAGDNYWDASDGQKGTVYGYAVPNGDGTYALTIAGNGYGKIFANADSSYAFEDFTAATAITGLNNGTFYLDTSNATNMRGMFDSCSALTALDVSGFDTGNVTNMSEMFNACYKLRSLDVSHFDTQKVTTMAWMFGLCYVLDSLDIGTETVTMDGRTYDSWDTGNVTNMSYMFYNCRNLPSLDVSYFDTQKVTTMRSMFSICQVMSTLDIHGKEVSFTNNKRTFTSWDTGNVTNMYSMFEGNYSLTSLDVSHFDTANVTDMAAMFSNCRTLEVIDVSKWDTEKLTTVNYVTTGSTNGVKSYIELGIFYNCRSLKAIDISGWDMSGVTNSTNMFHSCVSLESLTIPASLSVISPEFAYECTSLTEITFLHSASDALTFQAPAGPAGDHTAENPNLPGIYADGGAFYVPSYLETTINAKNAAAKNYDWVTDHRANTMPILGKQTDAWGGSTSRKRNVTEISFVDSYTPTGAETSTWDASDPSVPGTVTGYMLADTANSGKYKVIFAGNGSGVVYANPNSSGLFYNANNLKTINGLDFLDTSKTTDMRSMFERCWKLKNPAIGGWDVSNVTDFSDMFTECRLIQRLSLPNWDVSSAKDMSNMFDTCSSLISIDISSWDVRNVEDMSYMFFDCHQLPSIDLNNWNTQNVTTMKGMFSTCTALTSVGASNWNTAKVTDMSSMFWNCAALQTIDVSKWDTGNVTTMRGMFYNYNYNRVLTSLDVSNWDTGNVTTMELMFSYCTALTTLDVSDWDTSSLTNLKETFRDTALTNLDVTNWDVSNVTTLFLTFSNCGELQSLPVGNWDISNVTTLHGTFDACASLTSLDVGKWDTSNVTDMERLFYSNRMLTSLDVSTKTVTSNGKTYTAWDTGKVINMSYMFFDCKVLTKLDLSDWKTGNVATMLSMFDSCFALSSLDMTGWDTSQVTNMSRMFWTCSSLTSLDVSSFNTSAVVNMSNMFNSIRVTTLDLSNFDTSAVTNMSNMFQYANRLTSLDISSFDFTSVTSSDDIFTRSSGASSTYKIYVKDATAQAWVQGQASLPSYATVTIKAAALNTLSLDTEETIEKDSSAQSAEESSPKTSEEVSIVADEETIPLQDEVDPPLDEIDPPLDEIDPPLEVTEVEPTSEYSDNSDSLDLLEEPDEEDSITE